MQTPNGLSAIISVFGDVHAYVDDTGQLKPEWQQQYLATAILPFPLALAWNMNVNIGKFICHRLLVDTFENVFQEIVSQGLQSKVTSFGGCFTFRQQRTGAKLSTHAWGIAIDLNPATNQQGTQGDMDSGVMTIFRNAGFKWGGDWLAPRTDAMHFQFCTGY